MARHGAGVAGQAQIAAHGAAVDRRAHLVQPSRQWRDRRGMAEGGRLLVGRGDVEPYRRGGRVDGCPQRVERLPVGRGCELGVHRVAGEPIPNLARGRVGGQDRAVAVQVAGDVQHVRAW